MWLTEDDVHSAWSNVKTFIGQAWHNGEKALGTIDKFANVGMRLLGAGASTGLLRGRALESGLEAARGYSNVRNQAQQFGRDVNRTLHTFRTAVPELNL